MTSLLSKKLKIALVQIAAGPNKTKNLNLAKTKIFEAADNGAKLVVLPECFNSPYAVTAFPKYAEKIPDGETTEKLLSIAKEKKIYLIGGSFPEKDGDKIYNTSLTISPNGEIIGKHRKVHLFDIDIPNGIKFKESETLTGGNKATIVNIKPYGNVGIGICYDVRFPELAMASARIGNVFAQIYPGAFNLVTGPKHWHLLAKSRAVDNQIYVLMCSPARDMTDGAYHAYGHSLVVDPDGNIIAEAGEGEEIVYAELDGDVIQRVRSGIPVTVQRRFDVYEDVKLK